MREILGVDFRDAWDLCSGCAARGAVLWASVRGGAEWSALHQSSAGPRQPIVLERCCLVPLLPKSEWAVPGVHVLCSLPVSSQKAH